MSIVQRDLDDVVAHMPVVRAELEALAKVIAAKAEANLREHYNEGETEITTSHGILDWWVNLDDEGGAAGAIERGGTRRGKPFDGLHILGRAIGR